jgi:4'-phosphopantetheinyl transferase
MTVKSIEFSQVLLTKEIQFFLFDSNAISKKILGYFSNIHLHKNETITLHQRKKTQAQQEFIISRLLIKLLFINRTDKALNEIEIKFNEINLRLEIFYLDKLQPISISLSHSKGLIFIALSLSNVSFGVDIEYINTKRNVELLARHFYHSSEVEQIEQLDKNAFYRIWTLKEAISKHIKQPIVTTLKENIVETLSSYYHQSTVYHEFDLSFVGDKTEKSSCHNSINIISTQDFLNLFIDPISTDLISSNELFHAF